jgi:cobyric acid synthase
MRKTPTPARMYTVYLFRSDYFKTINPLYTGYDYAAYREEHIKSFTDMVAENIDVDSILQVLQAD